MKKLFLFSGARCLFRQPAHLHPTRVRPRHGLHLSRPAPEQWQPGQWQLRLHFRAVQQQQTNTGQVGGTLTDTDVGVTNGLFTVTLGLWRRFSCRQCHLAGHRRAHQRRSSFTALNPLQELTPTPYAIYSPNAGTAANVTGPISLSQLPAAVLTNNDTNSVNLTGSFSGNGSQLTNLSPAALAANGATVLAQTNVYATNGVYSFTIPSGIGQITVKLWGAGGQGGSDTEGGGGAFSGVTQTVTPGQEFVAVVGQNGGAGGGASSGDAGGGGVADTYGATAARPVPCFNTLERITSCRL